MRGADSSYGLRVEVEVAGSTLLPPANGTNNERDFCIYAPPRASHRDLYKLPEIQVEPGGESHLAFLIRKRIFAYYLFDHHGDGMIAFTCKSSLSEQRRLVKDDPISFFVPPYLGSKGWIAIRLDLDEVDWDTVT